MATFQAQNRGEIRRAIGRLTGAAIIGEVQTTGDTTSLIDTLYLRGGDDEHNGKQVKIYDATGSIVDGETSRVTDYAGSTSDATVAPAFTANITDGDKYEMWEDWLEIDAVNDLINQQIIEVSSRCPVLKADTSLAVELDRARYTIPSGFTILSTVEVVSDWLEEDTLADSLWTAATNVTAAQDTVQTRGHTCTKLTVAAAVAAAAQLGYYATGTKDLSNYDTIELWFRSTIAQTAANLEIRLCSDTAGVTAVDTMSLPAITAGVWTRLQLTMTNPELDTAIASIALYQKAATDIGACVLWLEYGLVLKAASRVYEEIRPDAWYITHGSTPYLAFTTTGRSLLTNDAVLQLTGYKLPDLFTSDTADSEVDPGYLINAVAADILLNNYRGQQLDTKARGERAARLMATAERFKQGMSTNYLPNSRTV